MKSQVSVLAALVLAVAGADESAATPLLSPYATRSSVTYEGGYVLDLRVCGNVLCGLDITTRERRLRLPQEKLAGIVDPAIGSAVLFVDMTAKKSSVISIEIPYSDFDRVVFPGKRIYVIEIREGVLHGISTEERRAGS